MVGSTERLDNIQALVLTEKLRRLPDEVAARRAVAGWYTERLGDLPLALPGDREGRTHAYHQFVIEVPDRERFRSHLAKRGTAPA